MGKNEMIIAKDVSYSLDCYKTQLNNNVLVVGASGSGKTRSIVMPNLLQATGSYIISDPKGNLYNQFEPYLRAQGYDVKKLDFTAPEESTNYNFFEYIRCSQDIKKIAHMIVYSENKPSLKADPFWNQAAELLLQALIGYLYEGGSEKERNFATLQKLLSLASVESDFEDEESQLDVLMKAHAKKYKDSFAAEQYLKFRVAADKTLRSILISLNVALGQFDTPEIRKLTATDSIQIPQIGLRPTALFVVVSDTDRSLDSLANIFFSQAMNELCHYADKHCKGNTLPIPVRFILDDFATNCKIAEFPRMIASIRSRGISTMLMIQSEGQLEEGYAEDSRTIIGNCDTYVYLGGNDVDTAEAVARRCDIPLKKILNMPVGTNWIFRRGQSPINGTNITVIN